MRIIQIMLHIVNGNRCYSERLSKKEGVECDELCNVLESGQGRLYHKDDI